VCNNTRRKAGRGTAKALVTPCLCARNHLSLYQKVDRRAALDSAWDRQNARAERLGGLLIELKQGNSLDQVIPGAFMSLLHVRFLGFALLKVWVQPNFGGTTFTT